MTTNRENQCKLCGENIENAGDEPVFAEAGDWLAEHLWQDSGSLCRLCLENRGRLAMMYLNEAEF